MLYAPWRSCCSFSLQSGRDSEKISKKVFTRWRNSHGFGVHSPFGFQLVERVIKRQRGYAYYAEEDIDRCCLLKHSRGNLAKDAKMLLRLACMLKFESAFLRPDAHPAFHAALKGANTRIRIVDNPSNSLSCDMIASRRDTMSLDSLSSFISMEGKTILLKDFPEGWCEKLFDAMPEGIMIRGKRNVILISRPGMQKVSYLMYI